eukprot:COSAG01_NODE_1_length_100484_cov_170.446142_5_plen_75_part_00
MTYRLGATGPRFKAKGKGIVPAKLKLVNSRYLLHLIKSAFAATSSKLNSKKINRVKKTDVIAKAFSGISSHRVI